MPKIVRTNNLDLTKYTGITLPLFFGDYSSDMQKIDDAYANIEEQISGIDTLVTSHGERITTLEACCEDVNNTLTDYGQRIAVIETVIDTVSTQNIDDIILRVNALENKVEANSLQIHEINDNLTDMQDRLATDETKIAGNTTRIVALEGRVTTMEDCCTNVNDRLNGHDIAISQIESDVSDIVVRLTRDEGNISANAQDIVILSQQVQTNAHNIDDIIHALGDLDPSSTLEIVRQVTQNTTDIEGLKTLTNNHTTRLDGYAVRFTQDEVRITNLERRMTDAEVALEQVGDWQQQIDDMQGAVDNVVDVVVPAIQSDVTDLGSRVTAIETFDATVAQYMLDNTSDVSGLTSRVGVLESTVTSQGSIISGHTSDIARIDAQILADETQIGSIATRVSNIETDVGNQDISAYGNTVKSAILEAFSRIATNVSSINAVDTKVGDLTNLTTTVTTSVVNAINSLVTDIASVIAMIGDLTQLTTTDKSDVVSAINEVKGMIDIAGITNAMFPVGSVYLTMGNVNPATTLGVGTWSLLSEGYLKCGGNDPSGGSMTSGSHVLTVGEMPVHHHGLGSHTHTMAHTHDWSNTHNHGITDPGHSHSHYAGTGMGNRGGSYSTVPVGESYSTGSSTTGISVNNKTISGTTTGASNATTSAATGNTSNAGGVNGVTQGHTHSIEPTFTRVYAWQRTA